MGRTVRQFPVACLNVALNYSFQAIPLSLLKNAKAQKVLPWVSLSGHTGVSISKELVGELADLIGPGLKFKGSDSSWWPYSTQGLIARVVGGILDGACYTAGVVYGTEASKLIRSAHGGGNEKGADKAQALMEVLRDFGNGELWAFLAPNGMGDWGHRITEAIVIAGMPEAKYEFKFFRKPEWQRFFVRVGIGLGVRIGVTGLCSSGWLKSIASESQAGYMIAGAYSAVVPAALRVVQPMIRDVLYQAYLEYSKPQADTPVIDLEAAPVVLSPDETGRERPEGETGDYIVFGRASFQEPAPRELRPWDLEQGRPQTATSSKKPSTWHRFADAIGSSRTKPVTPDDVESGVNTSSSWRMDSVPPPSVAPALTPVSDDVDSGGAEFVDAPEPLTEEDISENPEPGNLFRNPAVTLESGTLMPDRSEPDVEPEVLVSATWTKVPVMQSPETGGLSLEVSASNRLAGSSRYVEQSHGANVVQLSFERQRDDILPSPQRSESGAALPGPALKKSGRHFRFMSLLQHGKLESPSDKEKKPSIGSVFRRSRSKGGKIADSSSPPLTGRSQRGVGIFSRSSPDASTTRPNTLKKLPPQERKEQKRRAKEAKQQKKRESNEPGSANNSPSRFGLSPKRFLSRL